jgi:predicted nuclease of restriction endonuclease-like (RecB) superfamily
MTKTGKQASLCLRELPIPTKLTGLRCENPQVANLRHFLIEIGRAFTFIGNQHRLEVGGQEYFIDLLLFHRPLPCLIAIELKIGDFTPEHKGKIEFYLEAL